jgi:hypothetical protein
MTAIETFMNSLIDYAGLFPPADLGMEASVRNYATYRQGADRGALGRFIVPVDRLTEFERAAVPYLSPGEPWPLSVLIGASLEKDLVEIASFNERRRDARVLSVELKTATPDEILQAAKLLGGALEAFYEIPLSSPPDDLIETIQTIGGCAKIRTGGVNAKSFPSSLEVARFLEAAASRTAFKATAGLHHALPGVRSLGGPTSAPMHGFLNLFAAAAFVSAGSADGDLVELLEDTDARHFGFQPGELRWKGRRLDEDDLNQCRKDFARSFGSCSFEEPLAELHALGLR